MATRTASPSGGRSVRRTLVRVIMIVSSVAILLAGVVLVGYQIFSFRSRLVTDLSAQADMVAENCAAALSFDDARDAEMILASLRTRQPIIAAWVLDSEGVEFARYLRDDAHENLSPPLSLVDGHRFESRQLVVFRRVSLGAQAMGTVCLVSDLSEIDALLRQSAAVLALTVALSCGLALLLSSRLQRVISTPILELADTARRVSASRDYSVRAPDLGDDELGQLSHAFNDMLGQIQSRDAALKDSEERFRALVEATTDWIWETDSDVVFTYSSPKIVDLLGFEPEEMIGKAPFDMMQSGDAARSAPVIRSLAKARRPFSAVRTFNNHRDGRTIVLETSGVPIVDSTGAFLGYRGISRDITAAKQAEEELQTRERFLASLSRVSQQLLTVDRPDEILPEVIRHLGATAEVSICCLFETHGDSALEATFSLRHLWLAEDSTIEIDTTRFQGVSWATAGFNRWLECLQHGEVVAGAVSEFPASERAHLDPRGILSVLAIPVVVFDTWHGFICFADCRQVRRWQAVEIDLLRVAAAEIAGAIENANLVDRLRAEAISLEDRVAERTAELKDVNNELEAFAYSVSHDLRAPLRSIDGFSLALLEDLGSSLDEEHREHLLRVRAASQRMGRLIDGLLRLSRITRRELHVTRVDLSSMARSVITEMRHQGAEREVAASVEDGLKVNADPDLLRIVLENLVSNAWKFTSRISDPRVDISAEQLDGELAIRVRDNGAGFDMAHADQLFGAFQRLHRAEEFVGTGIGLATVQRIVHRHGGRVWAEAKVDQGASFYFTLG